MTRPTPSRTVTYTDTERIVWSGGLIKRGVVTESNTTCGDCDDPVPTNATGSPRIFCDACRLRRRQEKRSKRPRKLDRLTLEIPCGTCGAEAHRLCRRSGKATRRIHQTRRVRSCKRCARDFRPTHPRKLFCTEQCKVAWFNAGKRRAA